MLGLDQIRGMKVAIAIKVKHFEHELGFDHRYRFKKRDVEVLDEIIHVDALILLTLTQYVVETLVKQRGLMTKVPVQFLDDRLLRQVTPALISLILVLLEEVEESPHEIINVRCHRDPHLLQHFLPIGLEFSFKFLFDLFLINFDATWASLLCLLDLSLNHGVLFNILFATLPVLELLND